MYLTCLEIWICESRSTLKTKVFVLLCHSLRLIWQCQGMEVQYSVEYLSLVETEGSKFDLVAPVWLDSDSTGPLSVSDKLSTGLFSLVQCMF
jgi:hypothetical protein